MKSKIHHKGHEGSTKVHKGNGWPLLSLIADC